MGTHPTPNLIGVFSSHTVAPLCIQLFDEKRYSNPGSSAYSQKPASINEHRVDAGAGNDNTGRNNGDRSHSDVIEVRNVGRLKRIVTVFDNSVAKTTAKTSEEE